MEEKDWKIAARMTTGTVSLESCPIEANCSHFNQLKEWEMILQFLQGMEEKHLANLPNLILIAIACLQMKLHVHYPSLCQLVCGVSDTGCSNDISFDYIHEENTSRWWQGLAWVAEEKSTNWFVLMYPVPAPFQAEEPSGKPLSQESTEPQRLLLEIRTALVTVRTIRHDHPLWSWARPAKIQNAIVY